MLIQPLHHVMMVSSPLLEYTFLFASNSDGFLSLSFFVVVVSLHLKSASYFLLSILGGVFRAVLSHRNKIRAASVSHTHNLSFSSSYSF